MAELQLSPPLSFDRLSYWEVNFISIKEIPYGILYLLSATFCRSS